ncbi:RloB family protein [Actinoplanes lobatus]|uniref:RloB family protein n=1 Tax=Actinoplanes lobatus TaxID=113568 RepID=UPI00227D8B1E|nr:RloB family protein [Actinoplanes lobatus]
MVVFCEGRNSEPDYVNGLKRLPHVIRNTALNIEIHPKQGTPLTLVRMAAERFKDPEVDECWCLFDVEWPKHHPHLAEAIDLAKRAGVRFAVSNPCFELWLMLHHADHTQFLDTARAESESRRLDGRKGKSIDAAAYMPLRKAAAERAARLEKRHLRDRTTFPGDNPSSGMFRFLDAVEGDGAIPADG